MNNDQSNVSNDDSIARLVAIATEMKTLKVNKLSTIDEAIGKLEPLAEELRMLVGRDITSIINYYDNVRPKTRVGKQELAKRLNDLYDGLGLRVKSPKTGQCATIQVRSCGPDKEPIFEFSTSGRQPPGPTSMAYPKIELIPRDMRQKPRGQASGFALE